MLPLILLLTAEALVGQPTVAPLPRVGIIDYYGLRKVSRERVQKALVVREGDPLPPSKGDVEDRLEKIPNVVRAQLEAVCCEEGKAILFVGVEEKGAPHFDFRSPPAGAAQLPGDMVETYRKFSVALESAVRRGTAEDDLSKGHSLVADPEARARQEQFVTFAAERLPLLRDVLLNSANDEHRAMAACIIGYAPKKRDVTGDLQQAIRDPASDVRNNAMRALAAIAVLANKEPGLGLKISPTWLVEMLNSIDWSDRNKAAMALLHLTENRPQDVFDLMRSRALPSLVEMARWKSPGHALGPFLLLGRMGGLPEEQIYDLWTKGDREAVIAKVVKPHRKR